MQVLRPARQRGAPAAIALQHGKVELAALDIPLQIDAQLAADVIPELRMRAKETGQQVRKPSRREILWNAEPQDAELLGLRHRFASFVRQCEQTPGIRQK